jgi:hypothetical protein
MKTCEGMDVYTVVFLTSALVWVSDQLHAPAAGTLRGWMGFTACLNDMEK